MANIPIWPGSSSFFPGDTPFGFYDNDYQFQQDADKFAKFAAQRLASTSTSQSMAAVITAFG
jgi:hypothetical protein